MAAKEDLRSQLAELVLTDAMSANRASDTLREALVTSLVKKAEDMSPDEIFGAIERIDSADTLSRHEKMVSLLERLNG